MHLAEIHGKSLDSVHNLSFDNLGYSQLLQAPHLALRDSSLVLYFVFLGQPLLPPVLCHRVSVSSLQWNFSYFDVQFSWLPCSVMSSWLQDECFFFFLKIICIFHCQVGMIFSCRFHLRIFYFTSILSFTENFKRNICFFCVYLHIYYFQFLSFLLSVWIFTYIIISVQPEEFWAFLRSSSSKSCKDFMYMWW